MQRFSNELTSLEKESLLKFIADCDDVDVEAVRRAALRIIKMETSG